MVRRRLRTPGQRVPPRQAAHAERPCGHHDRLLRKGRQIGLRPPDENLGGGLRTDAADARTGRAQEFRQSGLFPAQRRLQPGLRLRRPGAADLGFHRPDRLLLRPGRPPAAPSLPLPRQQLRKPLPAADPLCDQRRTRRSDRTEFRRIPATHAQRRRREPRA